MRGGRGFLVVGVVAAVVACLVGVATAARGSSAPGALRAWGFQPQARSQAAAVIPHVVHSKMIVVRLQNVTATSVDNPPTGTSQGDEIAVEGQLVNLRNIAVGQLEVHEVFTGLGPISGARVQLGVTALLAGGQISAAGVIRANQPKTPAIAIVGGTGKYVAVHGEIFVHSGPHRTRLTFLLLPR
jgi:hypothetical protein